MPGVSLTPEKKLRIAHMLDELGVNVIEGGFARVSEGDLQALRLMAKEGLKAELCSMVRANKGDVDAALKAEVQSIHLVVPTSQLHLKYKLKKEPEEILSLSQEVVEYAKDHGLVVELSAEDGSRTDVDFLKRFFSQGISAGADRICLCDTVGVLTPPKAFDLLSQLREKFQVPLSIHCHDDFGMAVANTLEGLRAGADQAHVTVNGLGERAGNAALEEVVVGARYLLNLDSSITFNKLYEVSRLVSRLTGVNVQPNKAVVGDNAFAHESGIHVHAILSHPLTYEPLSPDVVGVKRRLVVGKHVGSAGIEALLRELGLKPTPEQLNEIFLRVKKLGDRGKTVTDSDLQAIAEAVLGLPSKRTIVLKELTVVTGDKVTPTASVKLEVDGREVVEAGIGIGPVDAAINAIKKLGASIADITLEEYHVKSITGGTDAVVEVIVKLRRGDRTVTASGARGDIVMASVEAVLSGMNTLMAEWLNKEKENS